MPPVASCWVLADDQSDEGALEQVDLFGKLVQIESFAAEVLGVVRLRHHVYLSELAR